MTRRRTLVFGDDRSRSADVAWLWIVNQPWPDWDIEVVTATSGTDLSPREVAPAHPRQILDRGALTSVRHVQIAAQPREALSALSGRDLLVVGPRGTGVKKRLHLGSVSEWLITHAQVPLLIARRGVATQRVVVCADGSVHSRAATRAFVSLPWAARTEVLVLSVSQADFDADVAARDAAAALAPTGASVRAEVAVPGELTVFYHPRDIMLEALERWRADLVVMGTRGLSGLPAVQAGSIARSLAGHAPCSVLMAGADRRPRRPSASVRPGNRRP